MGRVTLGVGVLGGSSGGVGGGGSGGNVGHHHHHHLHHHHLHHHHYPHGVASRVCRTMLDRLLVVVVIAMWCTLGLVLSSARRRQEEQQRMLAQKQEWQATQGSAGGTGNAGAGGIVSSLSGIDAHSARMLSTAHLRGSVDADKGAVGGTGSGGASRDGTGGLARRLSHEQQQQLLQQQQQQERLVQDRQHRLLHQQLKQQSEEQKQQQLLYLQEQQHQQQAQHHDSELSNDKRDDITFLEASKAAAAAKHLSRGESSVGVSSGDRAKGWRGENSVNTWMDEEEDEVAAAVGSAHLLGGSGTGKHASTEGNGGGVDGEHGQHVGWHRVEEDAKASSGSDEEDEEAISIRYPAMHEQDGQDHGHATASGAGDELASHSDARHAWGEAVHATVLDSDKEDDSDEVAAEIGSSTSLHSSDSSSSSLMAEFASEARKVSAALSSSSSLSGSAAAWVGGGRDPRGDYSGRRGSRGHADGDDGEEDDEGEEDDVVIASSAVHHLQRTLLEVDESEGKGGDLSDSECSEMNLQSGRRVGDVMQEQEQVQRLLMCQQRRLQAHERWLEGVAWRQK